MPKASPIRSTFNAGELSPQMDGRTDIAKYNNGCKRCENFIPAVQGPAVRRPGTRFVAEVKDSSKRVWLARFEFNIEQAYVLEFGHYYIRFYANHGVLLSDDGVTPYEVASPWSSDDLSDLNGAFALDMVQSGDVIYIAHPDYPTQKLSRFGNTNWTIEDVEFKNGPFEDQNVDRDYKVYVTEQTGTQFINNTDFATNITGWTKASSASTTVAWNAYSSGSMKLSSVALEAASARQTITGLVVGETYTITYEARGKIKIKIGTTAGGNETFQSPTFASGVFYYNFVATATTHYVTVFNDLNNTSYLLRIKIGPPIALTASRSLFVPEHVGSLFYMEQEDLSTIRPWTAGQEFTSNPYGSYRRSDSKTYVCVSPNSTPASGKVYRTGGDKPIHTFGTVADGGGNSITGTVVSLEGLSWQYVDSGYMVFEIVEYVSPTKVTVTAKSQWSIPQALLYPANAATAKTITSYTSTVNNDVRVTLASHGYTNNAWVNVTLNYTYLNNEQIGTDEYGNPIYGDVTKNGSYTGTSQIFVVDANTFDLTAVTWPLNARYTGNRTGSTVALSAKSGTSGTFRYAFGAFSPLNGYPSKITFFRERLTLSHRQKLHFSVAGDFENFAAVDDSGLVVADRAIKLTISSDDVNRVEWMVPSQALLIGTAGQEFACSENSSNEAFSPGNVKIEQQTSDGSRAVIPARVGYSTLFVQRSGRKLKEMSYNFQQNGYVTADMTVLAEHITRGGIVDVAWHKEPYVALWCVRADGVLLGFTFNKEQDVVGWHRHALGGGGEVESCTVIPSPNRDRDDLWLVVKRTINGQTKRYIEYLEREYRPGDTQESCFYVDSGGTYEGAPATTISGIDWLEGQTVQILADGAAHPDRVVTGGSVTLHSPASVVHIGLGYPSYLQTNRIEAGAGDGTAQGKTKRINKVVVRFLDTLGGFAGPDENNLDEIQFRSGSVPMDQAPPLFSGDKLIEWPDGYNFDGYVMVKQEQPLPMTVAAIMPQVHTFDR